MIFEKKITVGNVITLGVLVVTVLFGILAKCDVDRQIDLLKQSQSPSFIGSVTWSYSTSLKEGGDEILFRLLDRDLIEETDYWRKMAQVKRSANQYYVWLNLENTGTSTAALKQLNLSYEWKGKQEQVTMQVNRFARSGNRLFFLLFDFYMPKDMPQVTYYLEQNLKFSENDVVITFSYGKQDGETYTESVPFLPILSPPGLALPSQPKQEL